MTYFDAKYVRRSKNMALVAFPDVSDASKLRRQFLTDEYIWYLLFLRISEVRLDLLEITIEIGFTDNFNYLRNFQGETLPRVAYRLQACWTFEFVKVQHIWK